MHRLWAFLLIAVLAACQLALPWQGGGGRAAAPGPVPAAASGTIAGGTITTTALPGPEMRRGGAPVAAAVPGQGPAAAPPAAPPPVSTPPAAADGAAVAPAVPAALKTPAQLACEDDGGTWAPVGKSLGRACVFRTRDAGRACDSRRDCEGECLARARSCAPIRPLFGCNDILQADGRQVTLCID